MDECGFIGAHVCELGIDGQCDVFRDIFIRYAGLDYWGALAGLGGIIIFYVFWRFCVGLLQGFGAGALKLIIQLELVHPWSRHVCRATHEDLLRYITNLYHNI